MEHADWLIIRATPLFGALPQDLVERVFEGQGVRAYEKGVLLFEQGAEADSLYVVLEGWVKIFRTSPDGKQTVVHLFRKGETFAEAVIFMGGHYPVSAESATACRLVRVNGQRLRESIRREPEIALAMLASTSAHLKSLVEQIEQMKCLTAPQRLADFLLRLCPRDGQGITIDLPYEKSLLASRLAMEPESLSRAFAKLRPLGVGVTRDEVKIEDAARLRRFVSSVLAPDAE